MYKAISHKAISHLGNQVKSEYWCILTGTNRGLWLKTKIFQLFGQQSLYDIMNWHTYGNSWEKLYFQQLFDNIWRLPVGRSLQRAEQPHLLHRASIIPAIARREFKFQTMVLLQLNSYYGGEGGLCHHTQTTCALVKSARVSGCRSVPALRTIGLSGIKHVNNYWKNCHNIWDTQGSQRGKPIFNDVTTPLQALPISVREIFLIWWQLLNCICCDPVYGRFGSDLPQWHSNIFS